MLKPDGKMQRTGLLLLKNLKDMFIYNCRHENFTPNENLNVYEQLFPTKYRCRFTQHIPQKPDKYEIKIWILAVTVVKVDSQYLQNAIPYMGKDDDCTSIKGEQVTMELMEQYENKGYHITSDQFFSSLSLVKSCLRRGRLLS